MKEEFKIRTMGFGELAQMYVPSILPSSASRRLQSWIGQNNQLFSSLKSVGFKKHQKVLTPEMVRIIVQHLGPP